MLSQIAEKFNNNKETLKKFSKEMGEFNVVLEDAIITTINAIATKFMGKEINKRFSNYVNEILTKKYGTYENGHGYVSILVEKGDWDDDKTISFDIQLSKFYYRYNIKHTLITCNKFCRNQYVQEATQDNRFNEESVKSLIKMINNNRQRVAYHQDAAKNFNKYVKIVAKLEKEVVEKLGKVNPMFYDNHMDTNTYNTPNAKAFEEKMKQQGGIFTYDLAQVEQ